MNPTLTSPNTSLSLSTGLSTNHTPSQASAPALTLALALSLGGGWTAWAQPTAPTSNAPTDAEPTTGATGLRPQLPALVQPNASALGSGWRVVGFPKKQADIAPTRFEAAKLDGQASVRVSTASSYGTLVHAWRGPAPGPLSWRWRLEQPLTGGKAPADLLTKAGDDAALKVCVMFEHPLERLPFWERTTLRLARSVSGEDLPAATLCYVWDSARPAGLEGANPYTRRVRFISLRGSDSPLGQWQTETRDVGQDFARLFADESPPSANPQLTSVLLGADSDNTASTSLGWVADVRWRRMGQ